ncbi:MAG: hypothetical protein RL513_1687 [Pseudomonadota bacterium]
MPARAPAPPPSQATPMAFARAIVVAMRRGGLAPDGALQLAQITPMDLQRPQGRISALQMEWLSGAAMQALDDEALGAFSRRLPWGSYGMLARASLSAPDLGLAIRRWCRHHGLIADDIRLHLVTRSTTAAIVVEETTRHAALDAGRREFSLVHVLRNILGLSSWFVDSRIPLQGADFPFPRPPHASAYVHMFPGPLHFGGQHAEVRFDARYLALPLRRDEAALGQMLQRALPLTVHQYRRDRLLVQQVRQVLAMQDGAARDAEGIAALLNLSVRTLHRQLKEEGASLQQLKDEVRSVRARELLQRSARPVKQVAAAVGFRNEKSFIRAFRGWTGTSPADYRRRLQA